MANYKKVKPQNIRKRIIKSREKRKRIKTENERYGLKQCYTSVTCIIPPTRITQSNVTFSSYTIAMGFIKTMAN